MIRARRTAMFAVAALVAGATGYAFKRATQPARELLESDSDAAIQVLRNLTLPDLEGRLQHLNQWAGKVLITNFWATWCEPCREEIPLMVRMQSKYGSENLQIVGISIDNADKVRQFSRTYGINYPLVVAGFEIIELMRSLGNKAGGLPFTVVLNPKGIPASVHLGAITEARLEDLIRHRIS